MPVITVTSPPKRVPVDIGPHISGLTALRDPIASQLAALVRLRALLRRTPATSPLRPPMEREWEEQAFVMHRLLSDAYGHMALIATENTPAAWKVWDATIPPRERWEQAGIDELRLYWQGRTDPPHWITPEDFHALDCARVPAKFDPALMFAEGTA